MGIKFNNVNYTYPSIGTSKSALIDVNVSIEAKNEFVAVVGHTGSGKSTMIQHMNALLTPSSGEINVFGTNLRTAEKLTPIRKRVGMVFQFPEYQLFEETVERDIMFGPTNFGMNAEDAKAKAAEVMELVGLELDLLDKSPFNLSGGQMRRVAIAGILSMEPDILILDEPTVGLDPQGQKEMMDLFTSIHRRTNQTIILVTHDMNVVSEYCNRVIVMKKGEKVFDGEPRELFGQQQLLHDFNLDAPQYMKIMQKVNEKLGLELNETVLSLDDIVSELKRIG
jgi:energy-coupling factor transport system ATP-binding protein